MSYVWVMKIPSLNLCKQFNRSWDIILPENNSFYSREATNVLTAILDIKKSKRSCDLEMETYKREGLWSIEC